MQRERRYHHLEFLDLIPVYGLVRHALRCSSGFNEGGVRVYEERQEAILRGSILAVYHSQFLKIGTDLAVKILKDI